MTYRTPKTEHIEGKEFRTTPIFVEIQNVLFDQLEISNDQYVCPMLRTYGEKMAVGYIRQFIAAACKRAGETMWAKPCNNLRATRSTEVARDYGIQYESKWIGHGVEVAMEHYLQIEQSTVDRATGKLLVDRSGLAEKKSVTGCD